MIYLNLMGPPDPFDLSYGVMASLSHRTFLGALMFVHRLAEEILDEILKGVIWDALGALSRGAPSRSRRFPLAREKILKEVCEEFLKDTREQVSRAIIERVLGLVRGSVSRNSSRFFLFDELHEVPL